MIELLEPWMKPRNPEALIAELSREMREDGVLYKVEVKALAMRCDSDDVLFALDDGSQRVAVVHLTWSGKQDSNKGWPQTEVFDSLDSWISMVMIPDHEEYVR